MGPLFISTVSEAVRTHTAKACRVRRGVRSTPKDVAAQRRRSRAQRGIRGHRPRTVSPGAPYQGKNGQSLVDCPLLIGFGGVIRTHTARPCRVRRVWSVLSERDRATRATMGKASALEQTTWGRRKCNKLQPAAGAATPRNRPLSPRKCRSKACQLSAASAIDTPLPRTRYKTKARNCEPKMGARSVIRRNLPIATAIG